MNSLQIASIFCLRSTKTQCTTLLQNQNLYSPTYHLSITLLLTSQLTRSRRLTLRLRQTSLRLINPSFISLFISFGLILSDILGFADLLRNLDGFSTRNPHLFTNLPLIINLHHFADSFGGLNWKLFHHSFSARDFDLFADGFGVGDLFSEFNSFSTRNLNLLGDILAIRDLMRLHDNFFVRDGTFDHLFDGARDLFGFSNIFAVGNYFVDHDGFAAFGGGLVGNGFVAEDWFHDVVPHGGADFVFGYGGWVGAGLADVNGFGLAWLTRSRFRFAARFRSSTGVGVAGFSF